MDRLELRHKLLYQDVLPAPSPVVSAVLSSRESSDATALAKMLRLNPEVSAILQQEAARAAHEYPASDLSGALFQLSFAETRQIVFQHFLKNFLFAGSDLEQVIWERAEKRARIARVLAETTGESLLVELGPLAALVLEIGIVALDRALDGTYRDVVQVAFAKGVQVLEAEQRALGVDHTLAGKWAATRWNLPDAIVDVIWFRHHAANMLDLVQDNPELTHLVVLSDMLLADGNAFQSDLVALRLARLGLEENEAQAALTRAAVRWNAREIAADRLEPQPQPLREDLAQLRHALWGAERRAAFYDDLLQAQSPADALRALMESLVGDRSIAAATVVFRENDEAAPVGLAFTESIPEIRPLSFSGSEHNPIARASEGLVSSHEMGTLLSLPLNLDKSARGQIAISVRGEGVDDALAEIKPLCAALERAIARCVRQARDESRAEAMATALWRQEMGSGKHQRHDRLNSLAQVAAGAAHEINNPLAIVSGRAQMLLKHVTNPGDARALDVIIQQSRRASAVIAELLQFARPHPLHARECSINFLLHQAVAGMRPRLEAMGISIEEHYAENLPKVSVDRSQMSRVFEHLVQNAEVAMTPAGGVLGVLVKPSANGTNVIIQVSDTGRGIPAEHIDRIFEPFYKVSDNRADGGTGLGLAVCHGIVEMHHGTITIQSGLNEGSTCTITLPALADTTADPIVAPVTKAEKHIEGSNAPLIVLAESDEALRAVLRESLGGQGYRVACFSDGLEALAILLAEPVALLLCQHPMRTMGGENLLEQARSRHLHLPIVALGSQQESDGMIPGSGNNTYFISKPFSLEALLSQVRSLMQQTALAAGA